MTNGPRKEEIIEIMPFIIAIKPDILNLIEEKVGESLEHIGTGDNFLTRAPYRH